MGAPSASRYNPIDVLSKSSSSQDPPTSISSFTSLQSYVLMVPETIHPGNTSGAVTGQLIRLVHWEDNYTFLDSAPRTMGQLHSLFISDLHADIRTPGSFFSL